MRIQVIQNYVQSLAGVNCDHPVHEIEKLPPFSAGIVPHLDLAGGHFQSSEQGRSAMAFITVTESVHRFSIGRA
jgi:hypothetical protein